MPPVIILPGESSADYFSGTKVSALHVLLGKSAEVPTSRIPQFPTEDAKTSKSPIP